MAGSQRERSKDRSAKKLLLLLLCGYHAVVARAWNNPHGYKVAAIGSRKAEAVCSVTPSSSSGATVPLNHRHGPCSPAPSAKAPTILELLQHDQLRANSAACAQLGTQGNNCSSSGCQYSVQYFDGSNTTGTYGSDTLALSDADTVTDFHFGCSYHEEEMDEEKFDGLMGLGGDVPSLVSQTAATYGKSFSYCLPPTNSTSGFLTFGAPNGTSGFVTTPMLRYTQAPTFYGVLLKDISVGGTPLRIQSSVFSGGSVMDSGTVITWLPRRAYSALSSAFRSGMRRYPRAAPVGILDTCYDFTGLSNVSVPTVELVFDGGAVMDLDSDGIMIEHCLAFAPTSDESFIGNVQQRTFEVLHDVGQGIFGFRSGTC
uniref:Aspartic proteinase nepenthesin-1 n=1 Tax=Aegilops tauschii TaxID=37682 RepID=R7WBE0_AEGTA